MDPISAVFFTFGIILMFAGWVQLMFTSFREDFTWGLATIFVPPMSYLYAMFALDKAKDALILTAIGVSLVVVSLL